MRKWILLAVLIAVACLGSWSLLQRHRANVWDDAFIDACEAYGRQDYAKAEGILIPVEAESEKWWPNGLRYFRIELLLGSVYRADHNYDKAEPFLRHALDMVSLIPLVDSSDIGRANLNLAIIARDKSHDSEAEQLFSRALEVFQKNPRGANGDDGNASLNLGFLCDKRGDYAEAESFLNRAIVIYKGILGNAPHTTLANAHFNLAQVYRHERRELDAAEQYQEAATMYEKVEGAEGLDVAHALSGLSLAEEAQGNTAKARQLLERSQSIEQHLSRPGSQPDGTNLNNLGLVADREGKYSEAESYYKQSIEVDEKALGPTDPILAVSLSNLGVLYRDQEQFDIKLAEPLLTRALFIREKSLGPEHPDTAKTISDLSLLYFYEKQFATAERYAERALPLQERAFGREGLEVAITLNRLGLAQRDLGKFPEAEAHLKRALAIREKDPAPDHHQWIWVSLENLASVYSAQGHFEKAAPLIQRAREMRSR